MSEKKPGFFSRLFGGKTEEKAAETQAAETLESAQAEQPAESPALEETEQQPSGEAAEPTELPAEAVAEAQDDAKEASSDAPEVLDDTSSEANAEASPDSQPSVSSGVEDTGEPDNAGTAEAPETAHESSAPAGDEATVEVEEDAVDEKAAPEPVKLSWFQRLKAGLSRSSNALSEGIASIFTKRKLDAETLEELEDILIQADLGVDTAMTITERLADGRYNKEISGEEVREILAEEVENVLEPVARPLDLATGHQPHVVLMVGVNGTGKTTTIGKLSSKLASEGKKVMLAAGDTFRAAAVEQLKVWGQRTGAEVIARDTGADAAGLAFDAVKQAIESNVDVLLIDTAGRLQNRSELMDELEKIIRVIKKQLPDAPHTVLLTLDATTGQNALNQVEIFGKVAGVTGLVMTKLDGTARGGILVAISAKHKLPVHFIGVGEGMDDLEPFSAKEFAQAIAGMAE
ncbi:signal recognition particle-docking protein FtsY [Pseudovibrio exalbescens]|uniref:signal recognition particle-docking protein FtsY n=1 Tax=Pseudovibrio exalbescens TaxID=197461 RepID=UPI002366EABD|nr:signal recognition particle-docking protein FtsY [Pseudovibrio exalbescens]MDD7909704.1 signal recognition particle-docking protein FtsY [Pseudovibrio exalbescens]